MADEDSRRIVPWSRTATISTVRSLYTFRPADRPRWPFAVQAAVSIAAPIVIMTILGQPAIGYQAATGAFTALYASQLPWRERALVLPWVAGGLIVSAGLGVLVGWSLPLTLLGLVLISIASSVAVFAFRLGPPGAIFFVLTYGVAAHISHVAPGQDLNLLIALAAGCIFSYLVTLAPLLLPSAWREPCRPLREIVSGSLRDPGTLDVLVRSAAVAVIGSLAGIWIDPERAYWIVATGIAIVGIVPVRRVAVSRGIHRTLGTVAGAGLYFLLILLPWAGLWLAALLGALQFTIELLVVRHYAMALLFITPLVLLLTGAATGDIGSTGVALERIIDTAAGSILGLAVLLIPSFSRRTDAPAR